MILPARIGAIEFDGDEVRLVVVRTGGRSPVLLAAASETIERGEGQERFEAASGAVSRLLDSVKRRPPVFVLCASSELAVVRTMTIPFRGKRRVADAIPFELEPFLAFPIEELAVDQEFVREANGETDVLAIGLRRQGLRDRLPVLEAAGINVEGINLDVAGLTALWQMACRPGPGLHAVVHVRARGTLLAIVYNKRLAFCRLLALPAADFDANPSGAARQVQNTIRSFLAAWKGGDSLQSITVTGFDLHGYGPEGFEEGMPCAVQYVNLLERIKGGAVAETQGGFGDSPNRWEAAIGTAVAAAGGGFSFEFRKGELADTKSFRNVLAQGVLSACLAAAVCVGYGAYCFMDYRGNVAETARLGASSWALYEKAFPGTQRVQDGRPGHDVAGSVTVQYMEEAITGLGGTGDIFPFEILKRPTLLDILQDLNARIPGDQAFITELKVWPSEGASQTLTIIGQIRDENAFRGIFNKLKESTVLRFDEEPTLTIKGESRTFQLKGST